MSTQFTTKQGLVLAVRFAAGGGKTAMQMEVSEKESKPFSGCEVFGDDGSLFNSFEEFMSEMPSDVKWDNAARQNGMALEFSEHRFLEARAMEAPSRQRAKLLMKDSLSLV